MNTTDTSSTSNTSNKAANDWQKREIGALWKRVSSPSSTFPRGRTYLTGTLKIDELGEEKIVKVVVFSNADKKNEKAPDFRIYISKDVTSKESDSVAKSAPVKQVTAKVQQQTAADGDDIL